MGKYSQLKSTAIGTSSAETLHCHVEAMELVLFVNLKKRESSLGMIILLFWVKNSLITAILYETADTYKYLSFQSWHQSHTIPCISFGLALKIFTIVISEKYKTLKTKELATHTILFNAIDVQCHWSGKTIPL